MRFAACFIAVTLQAATFGTVVQITGAPSDIVLDEGRNRVYVVNSTQNRIEVYAIRERRLLDSIPTDRQPVSAALSRSGKYLYVTSYAASVLDMIDLDSGTLVRRASLPAQPEGVAVGADERVLITTIGSSATDTTNRMLLFDPDADTDASLRSITTTLPAPSTVSTPSAGQVYNASRSQLIATPSGDFIVGLNIPTTTSRTVFLYEVASATILRSRSVTNLSSVLSVSPDGMKFMSGLSLFDSASLAIVAQQNAANSEYPFPQNVNFNLQANQGGSVFAPDGSVMYSAFNIAPVQNTTGRANSSQLMLSDPDNLLIRLALQLTENLTGKMVITSNGATIYALSQSGMLVLPVSTIYDNPIAVPDSTALLLTSDQCNATAATRTGMVTVSNRGQGRMTVSVQLEQTGVTITSPLGGGGGTITVPGGVGIGPGGGGGGPGAGGGAPGVVIPIVLPGGGNINVPPINGVGTGNTTTTTNQQNALAQNAPQVSIQQNGMQANVRFSFNPNAARSLGTSTPSDFAVISPEAINIPARIRVYQNSRNTEANGDVIAAPVSVSTAEALTDLILDERRQRLYISNSGLNRVDVFDIRANVFTTPIKVGQLPRSLAMTPDGSILYVANSGGESVTIIDLEKGEVTGKVEFPPLAYNAAVAIITPSVIAATVGGLQMVMSNGALWKVVNGRAMPREASPVIGSTTLQAPRSMIATPGGEYALLLAGNGTAYLYDAMSDDFVLSQQIVGTPIQGYYGPMAAGPSGQYFIVNGQVLNRSLTPVVSSTTTRPVAAVAAVGANMFARFTQPARTNTTVAVSDPPAVELVDAASGAMRGQSPALEGPLSTQVGNTRVNVGARTMAIDSAGTRAYILSASGLTIAPIQATFQIPGPGVGFPGGLPGIAQTGPQVNQNGVVNVASYTNTIAPGSIIAVFGTNLASDEVARNTPLPSMLGGTCITLDNQALPLIMSSTGQINAQIPPTTTTGRKSLVVRSWDRKLSSIAQSITIAKYAPAIYVNSETGQAAVYHSDGTPVSQSRPAKRDEVLFLYATGLGVTKGGEVTSGNPAPADPLAETDSVQVYFGQPSIREAAIIVEWSGLVPGIVGVYQVNLRVPGTRLRGEALPVTLRIGGVSSTSGAVAPVLTVE